MVVTNRVRPKKDRGRCLYCKQNIWSKRRLKKNGCCCGACKESLKILWDDKHPMNEQINRLYKLYGGSFYTTARWIRLRETVLTKYGKVCMKCGHSPNVDVDHIVPISKCRGGYWKLNNLQVLCRTCNLEKGTSVMDYRTGIKHENQ